MSKCSYPVPMYRTNDGSIIHDNCKGLGISELKRPCGYCINCRLNKAESWAIRMVHHAQCFEENSFLTLTYDPENLPPNSSLLYDDVTKFIKKLRRVLDKTPYKNQINYYRVGEYGENFSRPHYHLILFGFDFSYKLRYKNEENKKEVIAKKGERTYYKSSFLTDLWDKGHADLGDVDYATCMYVAKYVTKKVYGPQAKNHYKNFTPEKASMSKGIGKKWLEKFWGDVYPDDFCIHENKRLRTPRYYDTWLEKQNPSLYEEIKQSREESMIDSEPVLKDRHRIHKVQILKQKNFARDGLAPDLSHDEAISEYYEDEINHFHRLEKQRKKCD